MCLLLSCPDAFPPPPPPPAIIIARACTSEVLYVVFPVPPVASCTAPEPENIPEKPPPQAEYLLSDVPPTGCEECPPPITYLKELPEPPSPTITLDVPAESETTPLECPPDPPTD
jgi:hypothetical protein